VPEEFAIRSDRHIVRRGEQETIAASARHIAAIRRTIEAVGHRGALERRADSEGKIQGSREQLHQTADGANQFLESTAALVLAIMPPQAFIFPLDYIAVLTESL
jgi:hypothetical protein